MATYAPTTRGGAPAHRAPNGARGKRRCSLAEAMRAQGLDEQAIAGRLVRLVNDVDGSSPEAPEETPAKRAALDDAPEGGGTEVQPATGEIPAQRGGTRVARTDVTSSGDVRPDDKTNKMRLETLRECGKMLDDAPAGGGDPAAEAIDPLAAFLRNVPRPPG